jgi:hypothetical protein
MLASLGLWWWQHMVVRGLDKHCIAVKVTGYRKTIITPSIQLRPSDPSIRFKQRIRRFPIKFASAVTSSKAQRQTLKRVAIYPPSPVFFPPMASSMWHFPNPLHLTTSLLQLLECVDSLQKMID